MVKVMAELHENFVSWYFHSIVKDNSRTLIFCTNILFVDAVHCDLDPKVTTQCQDHSMHAWKSLLWTIQLYFLSTFFMHVRG